MNMVMAMMRRERLRYAVMREIDRQTVQVDDEAIALLVDTAMQHIERNFSDDDMRGHQAEKAERSLMPVIAGLVALADGKVTRPVCETFLEAPSVKAFPWSASAPSA